MRIVACLFGEHNLWLVALAAMVCSLGSIITFKLFSRTWGRSGPQVKGWIFLTAVAAGSSAWCTHFIAMLAYDVQAPVTYAPILTFASLLIAIMGSGLAFTIAAANTARKASAAVAGGVLGLSVSAMHYVGMAAYHVAGLVEWDTGHVAASIAVAVVLAAISMVAIETYGRSPRGPSVAAGAFLLALVSLHFTGMAAVTVTPQFSFDATSNPDAVVSIAVAVAGVGLLIVGTGLASFLIDEQAAQEAVERLRKLALSDSLTGLPNRVHFNEYFAKELERASYSKFQLAVIVIDLNNFKAINDQRGHKAGDEALQIIGARLASLLKPGEFVARIGGDEFTAIKRYYNFSEVDEFLGRLQASLNRQLVLNDLATVTGGSIGVALYPEDGADPAQLLANADLAMYRAKSDPTRDVCLYDKEMDEAARDRALLTSDLRQALKNNEFELYYQVQHDIHTETVTGYEVLLRWRHPKRGMISPVDFIPLAEATGDIVDIGAWVLRAACIEAASWTVPHKIAVNISGVQMRCGDLGDVIHRILDDTGLEPSRLEVEITETAIIEDKVQALKILTQVRALGVAIAIDDFGVGYSSLETLGTFPFDKIKLDRSFTNSLAEAPQSLAIVRAVLALGESLNIKVLAEGVETKEQLAILRFEGCHEAQGYFLGRPAPSIFPIVTSSVEMSSARVA